MITIIHGDNIAESRKYLQDLKEKGDIIEIPGERMNLTDLAQIFESSSLFFEEKSVIIENYLSKVKKSKDKEGLLTYLTTQGNDHSITFWDGKTLTKSQYSGLKNPTEKLFRLPQTLFQFLDSLTPGNTKEAISLFHQTLQRTEPELLFFMIVRHFRILIGILEKSSIDEVKRIQPWQKQKLVKQATLFGESSLTSHYKTLFDIEKKQKSGRLSKDLITSIDFFLLSL